MSMGNRTGMRWMVGVAMLVSVCGGVPAADWFFNWGYRQQITIQSDRVSGTETLTNFPVLITGSLVDSGVWAHAQTNGNDILFTAADGTTKLAHDLEQYDAGSSQLCAWVKMPALSSASNTSFYMYYGRPAATNQRNAAAVWADYRAVWHLREASGTRYDASTNGLNVTPTEPVIFVTGLVDGAAEFDGITGKLSAGRGAVSGDCTVSLWAWYPSDDSGTHGMFDTMYTTGVLLRKNNAAGNLDVWACSSHFNDGTFFGGMTGQWVYVAISMSNDTARLYRNGAFRTSATYSGTPSSMWTEIGNASAGHWLGREDEVRVCSKVRSDAWLTTEYNNVIAPTVFAVSAGQEAIPTRTAAPWYGGWRYRQRVLIPSTSVSGSETLTDFPVLITESLVDSDVWEHAQANGNDILFTAADGTTKLAHDLEQYDAGSSQLCAWVQMPALSSASNTSLYMYYGRPAATDQRNAAAVWADYRAVWHLKEASGTRYDASTNGLNVTPTEPVTLGAGLADGAAEFDGVTGKLRVERGAVNGDCTVSLWAWYPSDDSLGTHGLFETYYPTGILLRKSPTTYLNAWACNKQLFHDSSYFTGMAGQWVYVAITMSNGTARLYRNGAFRTSADYSGTPSSPWTEIGHGSAGYWLGREDEVRVCSKVRSDAWLATEYSNVTAPTAFAYNFPVERAPAGTVIMLR
ncbi:MAG: DUF2341 domain-containing protein [Kiritimatiellae bacterium]|nr:DUF2341 domain-containing protein [Kiritimatiellia bacterium]